MKKNFYFFALILSLFMLSSCYGAKYSLKHGDYNAAVYKAARVLIRHHNRKKLILTLEQAYPLAVQRDQNQIDFLNAQGDTARWDAIFHIYQNMNERQLEVERAYPLVVDGRKIEFEHVNYNTMINDAKKKAADYYYHHAKTLMDLDQKFAYRDAFDEFLKAQNYSNDYPDADNLMDICYEKGLTHLLLIAVNSTPFKLDDDFMVNLIDFPRNELNGFWYQYHTTDDRNGNYDVYINIALTVIDVTPNSKSVKNHTETKKIEDGWEYKVDANGHIVTDTAGNKIKVTKYKTISCTVTETRQYKVAHLQGSINYVDGATRMIKKSVPVSVDHTFEHYYSTAKGDMRALSNDTKNKLKKRPAVYPSDIDMIYAANATMRDVLFDALRDNKGFVQNNF